jgi:hypothetical protein
MDQVKNPVIEIKNNNIVVNGKEFERHELLECKLYLQQIGSEEALFYPEDDEERDQLHNIIIEMGETTPEVIDNNINSYYIN